MYDVASTDSEKDYILSFHGWDLRNARKCLDFFSVFSLSCS